MYKTNFYIIYIYIYLICLTIWLFIYWFYKISPEFNSQWSSCNTISYILLHIQYFLWKLHSTTSQFKYFHKYSEAHICSLNQHNAFAIHVTINNSFAPVMGRFWDLRNVRYITSCYSHEIWDQTSVTVNPFLLTLFSESVLETDEGWGEGYSRPFYILSGSKWCLLLSESHQSQPRQTIILPFLWQKPVMHKCTILAQRSWPDEPEFHTRLHQISVSQTDAECLLGSLFEVNDAIIYLLIHYVFIFERLLSENVRIFVYSGLVDHRGGKRRWALERQK